MHNDTTEKTIICPHCSGIIEEWRPVLDYEGIYEASTLGRVRILVRRKNIRIGDILAQSPVRDGYLAVSLNRNDGSRRAHSVVVSRIVFGAFHGQIPPGLEVDHIDGVKTNNRPGNLEAVTQAVNIERMVARGGRSGERNGSAKLTAEQVVALRVRAQAGERFDHLARELGVSGVLVSKIAHGEIWKSAGGPVLQSRRGRIGRPALVK